MSDFVKWESCGHTINVKSGINYKDNLLPPCPYCRIAILEADARHFIAEFKENWKEGRVSIDCRDACDGLEVTVEQQTT
jgi:hypothetical protein